MTAPVVQQEPVHPAAQAEHAKRVSWLKAMEDEVAFIEELKNRTSQHEKLALVHLQWMLRRLIARWAENATYEVKENTVSKIIPD